MAEETKKMNKFGSASSGTQVSGDTALAIKKETIGGRVEFDNSFKRVFSFKEIIAVVVKCVIDVYHDLEVADIVGLIEDSSSDTEVSPGMTNTINSAEMSELNEYTTRFDVYTSVRLPADYRLLSHGSMIRVRIRLDLEMQRDSRPGYELPARGMYYCSRMISSQLPIVTENTVYETLDPVYSIWIVSGMNSDSRLHNRVIEYGMQNKTGAAELYGVESDALETLDTAVDLMHLYFVYLDPKYEFDDGVSEIVEFLSLLFSNSLDDERMKNYLDFSNDLLKEEVGKMRTNSDVLFEEGRAEGRQEGRAEGRQEGRAEGRQETILTFVTGRKRKGFSTDDIKEDLIDLFELTEEESLSFLSEA